MFEMMVIRLSIICGRMELISVLIDTTNRISLAVIEIARYTRVARA